jgi:ribosomal protein S18 acetylase RimI-like enzyme
MPSADAASDPVHRPEDLLIRPANYRDSDVVAMTATVQRFYAELYGGPDDGPVSTEEFAPPGGAFFVGYLGDRPVAMGGWRFTSVSVPGAARPVEIKRMYVAGDVRRRGLARRMLEVLESSARDAGGDAVILETGQPQTAAVALYRASGYTDIPGFGHYAAWPQSVSLGKRLPPAPPSLSFTT